MNWKSRIEKKDSFSKAFYGNERWITDFEGTERNEISLGPVANGLYFRKEKKGMHIL
jgi:hypothetical protein